MKSLKVTLVSILAIAVLCPPVVAQTATEQEVLEHIKTCWDAWMGAVESGDPGDFYSKCPQAENAGWWASTDGAPQTERRVRRNWKQIQKTDVGWLDFTPVLVTLYEDVAVVHFYGYWLAQTEDGPQKTEWKRTETYKKVGNEYIFLGAQGSPATPRDATPYLSS